MYHMHFCLLIRDIFYNYSYLDNLESQLEILIITFRKNFRTTCSILLFFLIYFLAFVIIHFTK